MFLDNDIEAMIYNDIVDKDMEVMWYLSTIINNEWDNRSLKGSFRVNQNNFRNFLKKSIIKPDKFDTFKGSSIIFTKSGVIHTREIPKSFRIMYGNLNGIHNRTFRNISRTEFGLLAKWLYRHVNIKR